MLKLSIGSVTVVHQTLCKLGSSFPTRRFGRQRQDEHFKQFC